MENQKILNLLNEAKEFKFVTKKCNIVNDDSKANYGVGNEVTYNAEVLKSNLCDYNDAYILVRGDITIAGRNVAIKVAFKNSAPFTKCITKIDETTIDDAENLDLVMPMHNLIEHSSKYSETTESLWFYSRDEATNFNADIANDNNFKSLKYKTKLLESTEADGANGILKNTAIVAPLKYLSNFWRSLEVPLINCKVELKIKWTKYCVSPAAGNENNINEDANANNFIFTTKELKLYILVVTLSAKGNKILSKLLRKGFERSVYWN